MTDPRNPEELSAELDRRLPAGTSRLPRGLSDDSSVNAAAYLAASPRPVLSAEARARMKAKMLAAVPAVPAQFAGSPRPLMRPAFRYLAAVSAAAAVFIVVAFGALTLFRNNQAAPTPTTAAVANVTDVPTDEPTDSPTTSPTDEPTVEPTSVVTNIPTAEQVASATDLPTDVPPTETDSPTAAPISTDLPAPTDEPVAAASATPELVARLTVEGTVEEIDGRSLVISGFEVEVAEDHPLLEVVRVEDEIRISGVLVRGQSSIVIAVSTIELVNDNAADNVVEVGPEGVVWRDDGDCSHPPPVWAEAFGWRARCEGAQPPGGGPGNNNNDGQDNPNRPDNPGRPESPGNSGNSSGGKK